MLRRGRAEPFHTAGRQKPQIFLQQGGEPALREAGAGVSAGYFRALSAAAIRSMAARLRSTSSSVVAHDDTLMRLAVWPCQTVPPQQQVPSDWMAPMTRRVVSASPKDTRT